MAPKVPASAKAFRHPDLTISHQYLTVGQLPEQAADQARQALADLGVGVEAARVDRRPVPLRTPLKNGQTVQIITSKGAKPNPAWVNFVVTAKALLARNPNPSEGEIKEALAGNLCRCTGYTRILEAVRNWQKGGEAHPNHESSPDLNVVSQSMPRVDARDKVSGRDRFRTRRQRQRQRSGEAAVDSVRISISFQIPLPISGRYRFRQRRTALSV